MSRGKRKRKTFSAGEAVRVCPTSDTSPRADQFVDATYKDKAADMRGWHHVEVADVAHARHIDRTTGMARDEAGPGTFTTRVLLVPTRRIRKVRPS